MRPAFTTCYLFAFSLLTIACGGNEDDFECSRNSKVTRFGVNQCYQATGNLASSHDGSGASAETLTLSFIDVNGGAFKIHVSTIPYQPPFTSIGTLETEFDYTVAANLSNLEIDSILKLNSGSVRFTTIDRTARKMSGTFTFNYVINNSSGNQNVDLTGSFVEATF